MTTGGFLEPTLPPLPPPEECESLLAIFDFEFPSTNLQITHRRLIHLENQRLIDFYVGLDSSPPYDPTSWRRIVAVDTSHRFPHVHPGDSYAQGPASVPEDCRSRIERAEAWAEALIWEQFSREVP